MILKEHEPNNKDVYVVLTPIDYPLGEKMEFVTDICLVGAFHTLEEAKKHIADTVKQLNDELGEDFEPEEYSFYIKVLKGVAPEDKLIISVDENIIK